MKKYIDDAVLWLKAHRSQGFSKAIFVAFLVTLLFFLGMIISPFLVPADTLHLGEDGRVGSIDFHEEIDGIENPLARFYYNTGDLNCHQKDSRSWELNGNQLPFCARDTAIFFGLAMGALVTLFFVFEMNLLWLILAFVPIGLDGGLQLVTSYESNNVLRFITGSIAGLATGMAIGILIRETIGIYNWRKEMKKQNSGTEDNAPLTEERK